MRPLVMARHPLILVEKQKPSNEGFCFLVNQLIPAEDLAIVKYSVQRPTNSCKGTGKITEELSRLLHNLTHIVNLIVAFFTHVSIIPI